MVDLSLHHGDIWFTIIDYKHAWWVVVQTLTKHDVIILPFVMGKEGLALKLEQVNTVCGPTCMRGTCNEKATLVEVSIPSAQRGSS